MENIVQPSRYMNEPGYIMVVKFKFFQFEEVPDIFQVSGNKVVHADYMKTFFDKAVTKMRAQETRGACDQYPFAFCSLRGELNS